MAEEQTVSGVKVSENDWKSLNNRLDDMDKISKGLNKTITDQAEKIKVLQTPVHHLVQIKRNQYNNVDTSTVLIPVDDTIPQSTEGKKVMEVSITPKNAKNILIIEAVALIGSFGWDSYTVTMALFKTPGANALAAVNGSVSISNNMLTLPLKCSVVADSTNPVTFTVNIGPSVAGWTITFNGSGGARRFGDIPKSYIQVTEVLEAATL